MLEVNDLTFSFDSKQSMLSNISFSLNAGDVLSIIGLNGAGKTTLLRCISQRYRTYTGSIKYKNKDLRDLTIKERAKIIGFASLNEAVDSDISVVDYLCMGLATQIAYYSAPGVKQYEYAYEICEKYGYGHLAERNMRTLSQGESQIVTILRVLMQNPEVIIFDEPTAALDLKNQKLLLDVIKRLSDDGKIIIQVTHNPDHLFLLGGKALVLSRGSYLLGAVDDILTEAVLSKLYETDIKIASFKGVKKLIY